MSDNQHDAAIALRAISEAFRYAATATPNDLVSDLADWADEVDVTLREPSYLDELCPVCQEIACDADCPMRHYREAAV